MKKLAEALESRGFRREENGNCNFDEGEVMLTSYVNEDGHGHFTFDVRRTAKYGNRIRERCEKAGLDNGLPLLQKS